MPFYIKMNPNFNLDDEEVENRAPTIDYNKVPVPIENQTIVVKQFCEGRDVFQLTKIVESNESK